ncbi:adenylate/guanylate cyclase domain-containing protein [Sulfitobacter aestuariivivens]|uniref:Adenylate/guanylate cyclase domain-containing protein n=1 Tax=Sulfitobacter aestuariivivens TaxID=2766981 RepID=A0A927HF49_9RHOB|nr:adenylate/guanylate cyclase domain-containing protein [Sulfitobacter aestuariivivens]MBD3662860.1 adenylate/guanylate cyclase domain-containing protein [Sulfitobacter aestuariivivens]
MKQPQTQYAFVDDLAIAYQVIGDGPIDVVYSQGWLTHIEYAWQSPEYARFLTKLSRFCRLIFYDKRGTGLSERNVGFPTLEQRAEDITAVLDAIGSEEAVLLGVSEGANMCALFAATYPERTRAVVLSGTSAKGCWAPDYPWAPTGQDTEDAISYLRENWGSAFELDQAAPSMARNAGAREWWGAYMRNSASPKTAEVITRLNAELDIRELLPLIDAPTLVVNREGDRWHPQEEARFIADLIPNAVLKFVPGTDHLVWYGDHDRLIDEIEEFVTGQKTIVASDRVLLTILMTDIVGSTELAADLGDHRWRAILDEHDSIVRRQLKNFGGTEVNTTGDGFITAFTGPTRAIQCARAITSELASIQLRVKAGIHIGECERRGDDLGGLAVHIASRILDTTAADQIRVSSTVKDMVVGSDLELAYVEARPLKGVPGEWSLYEVCA